MCPSDGSGMVLVEVILEMTSLMKTAPEPVPVSLPDLTRLVANTIEVFGSADQAVAWLETTNLALDGRTPISVYQISGAGRIKELLTAIDHGTIS